MTRFTKFALFFIAGLTIALVLQFAGVAIVPPDKTTTLLGVVVGAVAGFVILRLLQGRRAG